MCKLGNLSSADSENALLSETAQRSHDLGDKLLAPQVSAFRIVGGTVKSTEL